MDREDKDILRCKYCGGPAAPILQWANGGSTAEWWHGSREECVAFLKASITTLEAELVVVKAERDSAVDAAARIAKVVRSYEQLTQETIQSFRELRELLP